MKFMTKTSIALVVLASFTANAGQSIDAQLPAKVGDSVDIEHINGIAKIKGWDKALVQVQGELDDKAQDFIFKRTSGGIKIEVEMPHRYRKNHNNKQKGDNLVIMVPHESRVHYETINAQVEVRDIQKAVSVESVNGDITLQKISGKIKIETVNGDIRSSELAGAIRVETVNGDFRNTYSQADKLYIETVNGHIKTDIDSSDVRVESVNGNIELALQDITRLELESVNGRIAASFNLSKDGDVAASSVGGSIALTMQEKVSASFDIEAHAGGMIVNHITNESVQKSKYGPDRWLKFSTGDASGKVEISTVNGKITLNKHGSKPSR